MRRSTISFAIAAVLAVFIGAAFTATVSANNSKNRGNGGPCVTEMMKARPDGTPANEWAEYVREICGFGN